LSHDDIVAIIKSSFDFLLKLGAKCMHIKIASFTPVHPFAFLQQFLTKATYRIGFVVVIILKEKMKSMIMEEYLHFIFNLYTMQMCIKFTSFAMIKIFTNIIPTNVTTCNHVMTWPLR
jgi:hypothetical protein